MNDLNLFSTSDIEEGQQTSMVLAMEWYIMNSTGVRSLTCNLGELVSPGTYILHDSCADVMEELLVRIANEEENKYITKRHILAEQLLAKDLIPMIKYGSPDVNELQLLLRLLSELCQPCDADQTVAMPPDKYAYPDLKRLSSQVCEAFLDREFTSRLFTHIHELIEEAGELEMVQESYLSIKYLFTAIRNVLYLMRSEKENFTKLLSLLLENDLDSVLIYSINCHGRDELVLPAAQILSLLYSEFEWLRTEAEGAKEQDATCITDRLKRIVVQLLQGSLSALAISLMRKELKDGSDVEGSYLSWCLTYFLPYVSYVPVPLAKFRGVLSNKCVGYLVYQLSALVPGLFGGDPTSRSTQRIKERCMLLLSAFDSLLSLVFNFSLPSADKEDVTVAMQFYKDVVNMPDLWQILIFYIRNFDITMFPRSVLSQLICINHKLLTSVESYNKIFGAQLEQTILEHVKQFANKGIIQQYTLLVNTYSTNNDETNLAVFTMLSHICVECERRDLLYTPTLLRQLRLLSDSCEACDEDRRLAFYVTQSFLDDVANRPQACVQSFINSLSTTEDENSESSGVTKAEPCAEWTDVEEGDLMSAYAEFTDPSADDIVTRLGEMGVSYNHSQVTSKMEQLGLISSPSCQESLDLAELVKNICSEGDDDLISWLRSALLTASFTKAMCKNNREGSPLCYFSFLKGHSYPVIPYTERQSMLLSAHSRVLPLLKHLQLEYLLVNESIIPLIPPHLTAEALYSSAEKLRTYEADGSMENYEQELTDKHFDESLLSKPVCSSESRRSDTAAAHMDSGSQGNLNVWLSYMQITSRK